mmetsp:Transcript_5749/g.13522  ORF Transcript_5749/g.13522 Transcript_5749/m.13522 type:complete len:673 (+) Transcript_5749:64-2082(+)|eukprot:CAMPEP_0171063320 /NCGR_PEP_ID=MMETSP0766_2-20121228/5580_1 /TAXON_ID=439317 /ORGANISM="Gambierdiscus australes, Strain CAWD 149" /LENGTH=672 /DNA_ID=CAMNT_0011519205 /DNA_START=57 /DNA_END=2075 /DNA_ORIENTATION=+
MTSLSKVGPQAFCASAKVQRPLVGRPSSLRTPPPRSGAQSQAAVLVAQGVLALGAAGVAARRGSRFSQQCCSGRCNRAGRVAVRAENSTRTVNPSTNEPCAPQDFPKPEQISNTANYREAGELSKKFRDESADGPKKTVAIIGGGLSGLACAKYLADAGHKPIVLEARDVLGGKVSAWQDEDGDWIETGLHIFFGAYPNMMNLFAELGIEDRLQWKRHQMIFAMQNLPGEFTTFDFFEGIPAPLNFALAILMNQKMLTLPEKLQTAPPLLPMLVEGQKFIDGQDDLSVLQFMRQYGMPDRINDEVFIAMAKALDFIDPDKLSMTVVLTAMNRFLNETDGLQMAFLDGNQPDRLCEPMKQHIEARGGEVRFSCPLDSIVTNPDGTVKHLLLRGGEVVVADEYVSAVPCDIMKRLVPQAWANMPFFRQIDELEGIPVINIHLWFDRKLLNVDHLCFSRSPLLSVYADMSTCCKEYKDDERSMLELVFAPCAPLAGGKVNWLKRSDTEIVDATMKELERLFPTEIGSHLPGGGAKLRKSAVVRVPRSVYAAIPGRNRYRPSQETPIANFTLAGDWTSQKFLGSMEGAVLGGKLAAEVIADRAVGRPTRGIKAVEPHVKEAAASHVAKDPSGVTGSGAIAFGAGAVLSSGSSAQQQATERELAVATGEAQDELVAA